MRWRGGRRSSNIEDRRAAGRPGMRLPFPVGGGARRGGGIGIGTVVIALVVMYFLGVNPLELLSGGGGLAPPRVEQQDQRGSTADQAQDDEMKDFVDGTAFNNEQGNRARKLFAAVVLAALDDAIADDKKYGNGPEQIARWARSRDGRVACVGRGS